MSFTAAALRAGLEAEAEEDAGLCFHERPIRSGRRLPRTRWITAGACVWGLASVQQQSNLEGYR